MHNIQLGDIAEWLGSIGTTAAFIFAAVTYRNDLRNKRRADRISQARLFDVWITNAVQGQMEIEDEELGFPVLRSIVTFSFQYSNASVQAIRDLRLTVVDIVGTRSRRMAQEKVIAPNAGAPMAGVMATEAFSWMDSDGNGKSLSVDLFGLEMRFTDAAGVVWARHPDGTLIEFMSAYKYSWSLVVRDRSDGRPGPRSSTVGRTLRRIRVPRFRRQEDDDGQA